MEPMQIIESLGGGLSATVIVVQSVVIVYLFKRLDKVYQDRFSDEVVRGKENRELHVSSMRSVDAVTTAMEAFVDAARHSQRGSRDA